MALSTKCFAGWTIGSLFAAVLLTTAVLAFGNPGWARYIYVFQAYVWPRYEGGIIPRPENSNVWDCWDRDGKLSRRYSRTTGGVQEVSFYDSGRINYVSLYSEEGDLLHTSIYSRRGHQTHRIVYSDGLMAMQFLYGADGGIREIIELTHDSTGVPLRKTLRLSLTEDSLTDPSSGQASIPFPPAPPQETKDPD